MSEHIIDLININKQFGSTNVLHDITLYIRRNEFVTLLGPSGCGKTTTLRIIGGFEDPTDGELLYEGKSILNVPPNKRKINTVFQKYALFPHLNVYDNIAFGLKIKKFSNSAINEKVSAMLKLVNLSGFEMRDINSLSGGQQQRIAIARALVNEPDVLLLDEPLGALDLKLRKGMQVELKNIQQKLGITFVYVTHDQEEALTMSDTIVVMNNGYIQQIGTPVDIYNEPKNAFVAQFIGESNIVDGIMNNDFSVTFGEHTFVCLDKGFKKNELIDVVIRPEDIKLIEPNTDESTLTGIVKNVVFKGVHYEMMVESNNNVMWKIHSTIAEPVGKTVALKIGPDDIHIMQKVGDAYE